MVRASVREPDSCYFPQDGRQRLHGAGINRFVSKHFLKLPQRPSLTNPPTPLPPARLSRTTLPNAPTLAPPRPSTHKQMPRRPPRPPHLLTSLSPLRILTQILTLQLLYYLCTTTLILFTALTVGKPFTPALVFSWRSLRGDTAAGWTLGLCWMGGSFCG